jgi:hypothetical protein
MGTNDCLGWIWGPSCFITVVWIYFFLPEIKNRTLEEIDEMFEAKLPARKFRKYVCVGRHVTDEKLGEKDLDNVHIEHHVEEPKKSTQDKVWSNEKAVAEAAVNIE